MDNNKNNLKTNDYRQRIYQAYISKHFNRIRKINKEALDKESKIYKKRFNKFLPSDKSVKILDLGCGYGNLLYFLQKEGYKNSFGVDASPEQVKAAKELGIKNVELTNDIIQYLKNNKSSFDFIFAIDFLEHFRKEEIFPLLDNIFESLKNEGIFVAQMPNGCSIFSGLYRYYDLTHELSFTETSINQVFGQVGFRDIQIFPVEPIVHNIKSFFRNCFWSIIKKILQFYLIVETGSSTNILSLNLLVKCKK